MSLGVLPIDGFRHFCLKDNIVMEDVGFLEPYVGEMSVR